MNATSVAQPASRHEARADRASPVKRFFSVVVQPQSYRNLAFLLLGLPLGTIWFSVLVTGLSVSISMLVVALVGIPMLVGMWYVTRACANVERAVTASLLGESPATMPLHSSVTGNLWVRLRAMSGERVRRRELAYLLLRFPIGIATFVVAVTAIATPLLVAYAPFAARTNDEPFGDWALSSRMEDVASSPWSWLLVPAGLALVVPAFHGLNALARACGRGASAWLAERPHA
jgi:hypothetical protein